MRKGGILGRKRTISTSNSTEITEKRLGLAVGISEISVFTCIRRANVFNFNGFIAIFLGVRGLDSRGIDI
jgi:hypothetical protein